MFNNSFRLAKDKADEINAFIAADDLRRLFNVGQINYTQDVNSNSEKKTKEIENTKGIIVFDTEITQVA